MSFRSPDPPGLLHQEDQTYNNEIKLPRTSIAAASQPTTMSCHGRGSLGEKRGSRWQRQEPWIDATLSSDGLVLFKTPRCTPSLIYCSCRLIPTRNNYLISPARLAAVVISTSTVQSRQPQIRELTRPTLPPRLRHPYHTSHAALSWIQHIISNIHCPASCWPATGAHAGRP
jgi:hypothetical protein